MITFRLFVSDAKLAPVCLAGSGCPDFAALEIAIIIEA